MTIARTFTLAGGYASGQVGVALGCREIGKLGTTGNIPPGRMIQSRGSTVQVSGLSCILSGYLPFLFCYAIEGLLCGSRRCRSIRAGDRSPCRMGCPTLTRISFALWRQFCLGRAPRPVVAMPSELLPR